MLMITDFIHKSFRSMLHLKVKIYENCISYIFPIMMQHEISAGMLTQYHIEIDFHNLIKPFFISTTFILTTSGLSNIIHEIHNRNVIRRLGL